MESMIKTPPPAEIQNYWRKEVLRTRPKEVAAYLEKHGLDSLPLPEYCTPDQAIFYRERKGVWESFKYPGVTHGLVTAVEKNWLMAPPEVETLEADSTGASGKSNLEVGLEQLDDALKKRNTRETTKANPFKCTVKGCRRRFKSEAGVKLHFRAKHQEDN